MSYLLIFSAIVAGSILPIQGGINSKLAKLLGNPFQSAFIAFFTGTLLLALILVFSSSQFPSFNSLKKIPLFYFISGILGIIYLSSSIILIPKLGTTSLFTSILAGQLISSLLIDQFGLLGLAARSVSLPRILGISLIFFGVLLVNKY